MLPAPLLTDAISPSNQGGELHKPSGKLIELCAPLHPLEFGLVYLLTHKGIGDRGTVSCGPADPSQFDKQLRALKLVPHAAKLLPPIVSRLRAHAREVLGTEYCNGLGKRVGSFTQGNEAMPDAMNLSILMVCHGLGKAFDMTGYMKRMGNNMAWPGDWCAGGGLDTLRDISEDDPKMTQFRNALAAQGGGGAEDSLGADKILENLRWMMADIPQDNKKTQTKNQEKKPWKVATGGGMKAQKQKGCLSKVVGKTAMGYIMWWYIHCTPPSLTQSYVPAIALCGSVALSRIGRIRSSAKLYGAVPATEHGIADDCWSKVKTKN